ncbi:MAG: hypothetical protein JXA37_01455, partial [Chloroflexia bacterium]|nr:hypothetical protein [Chloroflexia bacterium]
RDRAATVNYGIYAASNLIPVNLDYNDVADWSVNYYNVAPGPNDISEDPQFVDVTTGDYHLKDSSPCIDQGSASFAGYDAPTDDIDGETRPQDGGYDHSITISGGGPSTRSTCPSCSRTIEENQA